MREDHNPANLVHRVNNSGLFDYDALGHRVRKIDAVASQTTLYYNDPEWRVLAEYDGTGTLQRTFVWGNYIAEALRMRAGGSDYYYLHDHLYSPAALLDSAGAVVERYEFDSYGTRHVFDQNFGTRANTNYGVYVAFQGHIHDRLDNGNLNLLDARYRTYDPFAGRWLMHDKLGMIPNEAAETRVFDCLSQYNSNINLYESLASQPSINLDHNGLWGYSIHKVATSNWAKQYNKMNSWAADLLGEETLYVDTWRSPIEANYRGWHFAVPHVSTPQWGPQDSRYNHAMNQMRQAISYCNSAARKDQVGQQIFTLKALEALGRGLHPLEDWVAHGTWWPYPSRWHFGLPIAHPEGTDDENLDFKYSYDGILRDWGDLVGGIPKAPYFYKGARIRYDLTRVMVAGHLEQFKKAIKNTPCYCIIYRIP